MVTYTSGEWTWTTTSATFNWRVMFDTSPRYYTIPVSEVNTSANVAQRRRNAVSWVNFQEDDVTVKTRDEALPQMAHWPLLPGAQIPNDQLDVYARSNADGRCDQRRNGWICTREEEHSLPHVAVGGSVVAVWDQSWYWDTQGDPTPTHEVTGSDRQVFPAELRGRTRHDPF